MIEALGWVVLAFASLTTLCFLGNFLLFHKCGQSKDGSSLPSVSVLIPARDEAEVIRTSVEAVLANHGVNLEVVVLDDQSRDQTPEIVRELARSDGRVRLIQGQALASGWCGKQYACGQLAEHARYDELLFIDADVRLRANAIERCLAERQRRGVDLLSGFPRQIVGTLGEALLLPLMHIVLLTYLPFPLMRLTKLRSASAGCGQLFLTSREAYRRSGGHGAIRLSMHDGVTLPRAYRHVGLKTDVVDASDLAACRMYHGWRETVDGLLKNAHEGIANRPLIVPFTAMMVMGYVAPILMVFLELSCDASTATLQRVVVAAAISYLPRILSAVRFDRAWYVVPLFPLSVLIFLMIQWLAFVRLCRGQPSTWRGRVYEPTTA